MKKSSKKMAIVTSAALAATMVLSSSAAFAGIGGFGGQAGPQQGGRMNGGFGAQNGGQGFSFYGQQGEMQSQNGGFGGNTQIGGQMNGGFGAQFGQQGTASTASSPSTIVTSELTSNSAEELTADYENATTIVMSDENNSVTIKAAGTYIVTGSCADGNIKVKKGTTGVVLILKDLDLTSSVGATLSLNKGTETKVIIEGTVKLTDAESLADEDTDDFDGAVIKAKAGSSSVLTGSGTLYVNGNCKNGIKVSDLDEDDIADGYSEASFIVDGATIIITAANDGMNSGTDLTVKSGNITVSAGDDGIKADYILTIGDEETGEGPTINIKKSYEGIEGATINIYGGNITINASDDGINAANGDLSGYTYSLNVFGGTINVSAGSDGIDSNGNVNFMGGLTTIVKSASNGGDGGLDYDGVAYIAEGTLVNPYGTTMDSGMGGRMGQGGMNGGFGNKADRSEQGGSRDLNNGSATAPTAPSDNSGNTAPSAPTAPSDNSGNTAPSAPSAPTNGNEQTAPAAPSAPSDNNSGNVAPTAPTAPARNNSFDRQGDRGFGGQQAPSAPAQNGNSFGGQQAPNGNIGNGFDGMQGGRMNGGFGPQSGIQQSPANNGFGQQGGMQQGPNGGRGMMTDDMMRF